MDKIAGLPLSHLGAVGVLFALTVITFCLTIVNIVKELKK